MPPICRLFIFALICTLVACVTPSLPPPQLLGQISEWETKLLTYPSTIKITASVLQGSTAKIQLLDYKKRTYNIPASIIITDQDCDAGHQIIVEYNSTFNEILRKYFTTVVPWSKDFNLELEQHENNDYTLTINNESIKFNPYKKAKHLHISSTNKGFIVSNFQYSKIEKIHHNQEDKK